MKQDLKNPKQNNNMKKKIFLFISIAFGAQMYSQVLLSDTFETYNIGPIGSQGGWGIANNNGSLSNMAKIQQIDAVHNKSLQFESTASDGYMFVYHPIDWSSRISGNDVFSIEAEAYIPSTGAAGISSIQTIITQTPGGTVYSAQGVVDIYLKPGYASFYDYNGLEHILNTTITANTWYKIMITYDTINGIANVKIGNDSFGPFSVPSGRIPDRIDLNAGHGGVYPIPSEPNTAGYDNLIISAKNAGTLSIKNTSNPKLSIYPNPAVDFLNIAELSDNAMYKIYNTSEQLLEKGNVSNGKINVSSLTSGVYILTIEDKGNNLLKSKFIKK